MFGDASFFWGGGGEGKQHWDGEGRSKAALGWGGTHLVLEQDKTKTSINPLFFRIFIFKNKPTKIILERIEEKRKRGKEEKGKRGKGEKRNRGRGIGDKRKREKGEKRKRGKEE